MVKTKDDYIELLLPEDLETLGRTDHLYIETDEKTFHLRENYIIQCDDCGICFIDNWDNIKEFDYDEIDMYRVRNYEYYKKLWKDSIFPYMAFMVFGIILGMFSIAVMVGGA